MNQSKSPRVAKIQSDSPLKIPISKYSINQAECLTLEKLQLIKPKLRTEEEKKQLRHLKYISKKESLTVKKKESIKQKDQNRKQQERETLSEKEKENSRQKDKDRLKLARENLNIKEKKSIRQKDKKRKSAILSKKEDLIKRNKERYKLAWGKLNIQEKEDARQKNKERMELERKNLTNQEREVIRNKDRERKQMSKILESNSDMKRLRNFQKAVRYSAIFTCSCCHQQMFRNGVSTLNIKLEEKFKNKCLETYNKVFAIKRTEISISEKKKDELIVEPNFKCICTSCKRHLNQGKVPPMAVANNLGLVDLGKDEDLKLSELENNLIAKRLLFQKIYQLPKSRMAGCKDRLINIPINDEDVMNTIESMPRTPNEAGLLEVKLKRKLEYANNHKMEFVNPEKLYKSLAILKKNGHPSYQFYSSMREYQIRCQKEILECNKRINYVEDGIENIVEFHEYLATLDCQNIVNEKIDIRTILPEEDVELLDEIEYITMDPIRKFQFDYDKSVCLVDKFPEAALSDNQLNNISFAPGEGKVPENILKTDKWDIEAFPMKHPDGRNGIHESRDRRLTDQQYITQRLRNKDSRFSSDPSYVFACAAYLEKMQLQRNVNISFQRGKQSVSSSGQNTYSLEDGFSVFDKIKNTPTYWKTAKYEMLAKLENLGPFQFFFTLSCADSRWDENFSSLLRLLDVTVRYDYDTKDGMDQTTIIYKEDKNKVKMSLKDYLDNKVNTSMHELIRTNVLNATRNYNQRVKAFIKTIVMDKNNPMSIEHYSTKVEFQGRGAGHNHGVLWANVKKMQHYFRDKKGKLKYIDEHLST